MKPHIAINVECMDDVPRVAEACGLHPSSVTGGLITLWLTGQALVSEIQLRECFGGADVAAALAAFGFVTAVPDRAEWHVNAVKGHLCLDGGLQ